METTAPATPKQLGNVLNIHMSFKKPAIVGQDLDLNANALTLMTGKNGTGKSFIMKLIWAASSVAAVIITNRDMPSEAKIHLAQFYINGAFVDTDQIDGTVEIKYEFGDSVEIAISNGVVTHVNELLDPKLQPTSHPRYLSTNMRLMVEVTQYMKMKKALGIGKGIPTDPDAMMKLCECYRLYDIMHAEDVIRTIDAGNSSEEFLKEANKRLAIGEDHFDLKGLKVDYDACDIKYKDKDDLWLSVASMGAGHQSLLNMFICQ
jgi:energy-coupling factor transporter ATP-binding protein EcfA2